MLFKWFIADIETDSTVNKTNTSRNNWTCRIMWRFYDCLLHFWVGTHNIVSIETKIYVKLVIIKLQSNLRLKVNRKKPNICIFLMQPATIWGSITIESCAAYKRMNTEIKDVHQQSVKYQYIAALIGNFARIQLFNINLEWYIFQLFQRTY